MNRSYIWFGVMFTVLGLMLMGIHLFPAFATQTGTTEAEQGVDVLTYGPIHEAFGETVQFDPEPGIIVPKSPPDAIHEIPPEQKPEGDVVWIPGYWAWDDDRTDFIWVSGIWRVIPPDRQWVPGYWFKARQGYQWVSGYWAADETTDTEYLPEPPESVEVGPNVAAPSSEYAWIPGCWVWYGGRYAWRPGYWVLMKPDWIWIPAHYVWTPRGYIFVAGYWDLAVNHRGVLFAPVFFSLGLPLTPGFYFTPTFIIDLRIFSDLLFVYPRYHHYYFGDYYAPRYYRKGIYPWFSPHAMRRGYDPIYAHQRWKNRYKHGWEKRIQAEYQARRNDVALRPPRKLDVAGTPVYKPNVPKVETRKPATPFPPVTKIERSASKFQPLSKKERKRIDQRNKEVIVYTDKRQKLETRTIKTPTLKTSKKTAPSKLKLPKSPIAAKPNARVSTQKVPPNRYKAPKLNPTVEPLKRKSYEQRGGTSVERLPKAEPNRTFNPKPTISKGQIPKTW